MIKVPRFSICAAALFAVSAPFVGADTITLSSGEQLQGKVVSETATEMVVDVEVARGITDQRTLKKKDVKSVAKIPEDDIAFESIKTYKLGANSYTPADYDALARSLSFFVSKYPTSAHAKEVTANLTAVKAEKARVDAGEMKWNNRWYSAEEATQEKYQIDADKLFAVMKEQATRGETVTALNTFDYLEKNYPGAVILPNAVETALALIKRLEVEMDRAVSLAKLQKDQFDNSIVIVAEPQKTRTINARNAQIAAADNAVAMAEHSMIKWKPLLAITDKSPQAIKTTIEAEVPRLSIMPISAIRNSIVKVEAAVRAFKAGNIAVAEVECRDAQTLWPANEVAARLSADITAFKSKPAPTPTPTPTPPPVKAPNS